jgi:Uma2 family endonuclease
MVEYTPTDSLSTAAEPSVRYLSNKVWTFEEYIEAEMLAEDKHEFDNGKRITMPGASRPHAIINMNVGTAINVALNDIGDEDTEVYSNDMKVFIPTTNKAVYPDLSAVKGEPQMKHKHVILNPLLIVEILSKSTKAYDKGKKFDSYKTLSSFKEYVLVEQDKPLVEVFYREKPTDKEWISTRIEGLEATFELRSIGCTLKMRDIYRRVFK